MLMVIPDEGKNLWLDRALGRVGADTSWRIRLYQNNYTPVDGSTLASFTESTFTGYSQVTVTEGAFGAAVVTANVAEANTSSPPTYTCTGGSAQNAYGWYMVGVTTGKVYAAQKFDNVRSMAPGAVEELDPFQFSLKTFA